MIYVGKTSLTPFMCYIINEQGHAAIEEHRQQARCTLPSQALPSSGYKGISQP